jgi:hypothetical protein
MKKLFCVLLALVLSLAGLSCFAEGTDLTSLDVEIAIPAASEELKKGDLADASQALTSTDEVTNDNGNYTVKTSTGTVLKLQAANSPYLVFSQSFYASLQLYSRLDYDVAIGLIDDMINLGIHYFVLDGYQAFDSIQVGTRAGDALTQHVRDLSTLNENELNQVGSVLAEFWSEQNYALYTFGDTPWIQVGANTLITIKNSEYVMVYYIPTGETMTEDDYADFTDFMKVLTVE